ncbi:MAG TPA: hypothetical protein VFX16_09570 [Pseudonocardiaceae bacterium]|nr:hypothetical protein [Pseudonocardiaceae bacterium]
MGRRTHRSGDLADSATSTEFGYRVPQGHWRSRLAPYAAEWAGWLATGPAAEGTHLWLGSSATLPWSSVALTLLGAGLSALTWRAASTRSAITRAHATATTAAGSAWLLAGTIVGPLHLAPVWVLGGAALCLSWNIRRALRNSGAEESGGNLFEQVRLAKVRATSVEAGPNKVTARLQLPPGETTVEDVQKAADRLAGALRLHKGAVRTTGDPEDLSQATMTVVPVDLLTTPQPWPGPSAPGGSMAQPLVTGLYEDAEPVNLFLPGDVATHRNATHLGVMGMNGSGKTVFGKLSWTEILTRRDVCLIVLDPSKGEQSVGFLSGKAHLVLGEKACRSFVKKIPAAITAHATQLGRWGYDQWTPEVFARHGLPLVVVWIEEAPRVLQDAETLTRIAQEARSAGIPLVLSLQKATYRQMSTDIRSQLGAVACFGVKELEDAAYLLSEDTIDAGARPDRWQNRRPGALYLEGPGIAEDRFPIPARTFTATDEQLRADITACDAIRATLHPLTAAALGLPQHPAALADTEESVVVITDAAPPRTGRGTPAGLADLDQMPLPEDDETLAELPEDPEPELAADPDAELPIDPELEFPEGRPTRRQALAMVRSAIEELAAAGRNPFTIRDLPDPEPTLGRGRQWLSGELSRLAREGVLEIVGGDEKATVYQLRTRANTGTSTDTGTRGRDAA